MDARKAVETLAIVGIGVFAIVIILSLTYQGYAQTQNSIQNQVTCSTSGTPNTCNIVNPANTFYGQNTIGPWGTLQNFTKYASPLPNTYASNLGLAITALVLFVVIAIIAGLFLNQKGGGVLGGE